jgi:DNA-binding SARP family transcriptional activator
MGTVAAVERGGRACSLALLGTFQFRVRGVPVELPRAAERLVAYLALQESPVSRTRVATALWPEATEQRSLGCLRSALWRVRLASRTVVAPDDTRLGLAPGATVDVADLDRQTHRLLDGSVTELAGVEEDLFGPELLPGWDEDWITFERERLRQLSLRGLEALSRRHLEAGRVLEAVEAAWRAITLEPLRETAHGALIDAHLAEGNVREAVDSLKSLAQVLGREIGISPSPALVSRVASAVESRRESALTLRHL